jgi:hypothetical protein
MTAIGGVAPYKWLVQGGVVPPGLTINPATGVISGTPTSAVGAVNIYLNVYDQEPGVLSYALVSIVVTN